MGAEELHQNLRNPKPSGIDMGLISQPAGAQELAECHYRSFFKKLFKNDVHWPILTR
jgi:hypothetical protein